jgi:hypothetical protein
MLTVDKVGRTRVPAGGGGHGAGLVDGEPPPQWSQIHPSAAAKEREEPTGRPRRPGRREVGGPRPERRPGGLSHPRDGSIDDLLQPLLHGAVRSRRRPSRLGFYDLRRAPASVAVPAAERHAELGLRQCPEAARQAHCTRERPRHGSGGSSGAGARACDGGAGWCGAVPRLVSRRESLRETASWFRSRLFSPGPIRNNGLLTRMTHKLSAASAFPLTQLPLCGGAKNPRVL